ncbi:MAG: hypothetical protein OWQ54_01725 [Sulfolobaceae archaeon]|nr:hypothetical protein [Sulfolobaceae archaeon]
MNVLDEIKEEYGFSDEEIEFALNRAKGILVGFAMEYRAINFLKSMNFDNIRYVDLPTHDFEAEKDGKTYFIEVKASKKSPTKEYSPYKVAMIAMLKGTHLTLLMKPSPLLIITEDILSEPKRVLFEIFKSAFEENYEMLQKLISDDRNKEIIKNYVRVIKYFEPKLSDKALFILKPFLG